MSEELQIVYLARHGETAWSLSGQYTGRTDLPLPSAVNATPANSGNGCAA